MRVVQMTTDVAEVNGVKENNNNKVEVPNGEQQQQQQQQKPRDPDRSRDLFGVQLEVSELFKNN